MAVAYNWWMEVGRNNLWNDKFNNKLYEMQMRNRFKWLEKNVPEQAIQNSINIINSVTSNNNDAPTLDVSKLSLEELDTLRKIIKKSKKEELNNEAIDIEAE